MEFLALGDERFLGKRMAGKESTYIIVDASRAGRRDHWAVLGLR